MKLCLGTVQFGMDYGVFNLPKKDPDYCLRCIDYAVQNGIDAIDTASAYGIAEELVGKFISKKTIPRDKLCLSTKLMPNILDNCEPEELIPIIRSNLLNSLKKLNVDYVDTYYFHSSRYSFEPELLEAIGQMRKEGLASKVGVSVYYPEEAFACFENDSINCIQAPYSIFDHRMKQEGVFKKGVERKCSIDVRTAFIKGLIRLQGNEVPDYLSKAIPILSKLDSLCEKTGYSRVDIALGYIKREKPLNHLVFGIRTLEQLKEDIESFEKTISNDIFEEIDKEFANIATDIVVPSLWIK